MYILYLDESGTHSEASYFVLAGLAVFEREIHWFSQDLDALQREYFPAENEPVFFPTPGHFEYPIPPDCRRL